MILARGERWRSTCAPPAATPGRAGAEHQRAARPRLWALKNFRAPVVHAGITRLLCRPRRPGAIRLAACPRARAHGDRDRHRSSTRHGFRRPGRGPSARSSGASSAWRWRNSCCWAPPRGRARRRRWSRRFAQARAAVWRCSLLVPRHANAAPDRGASSARRPALSFRSRGAAGEVDIAVADNYGRVAPAHGSWRTLVFVGKTLPPPHRGPDARRGGGAGPAIRSARARASCGITRDLLASGAAREGAQMR